MRCIEPMRLHLLVNIRIHYLAPDLLGMIPCLENQGDPNRIEGDGQHDPIDVGRPD
jgi:hypothetical protein